MQSSKLAEMSAQDCQDIFTLAPLRGIVLPGLLDLDIWTLSLTLIDRYMQHKVSGRESSAICIRRRLMGDAHVRLSMKTFAVSSRE